MKDTKSKLTLRALLFVSFIIISTIPVILLSLWIYDSALKKEYEAVNEKHLIIAKNLTSALSRYILDLKTSLDLIPSDGANRSAGPQMKRFYQSLSFSCISHLTFFKVD